MSRTITINEAELALPDDKLPEHKDVQVISAFIGGTYPSLAAMIKRRKRAEAQLDSQMSQWQRDIVAPCFVVYGVVNDATGARMAVYGNIPGVDTFIRSDRVAGVPEERLRRLRKRMENADARGWLYGQWHSRTQPAGEWGVMHRAIIGKVLTEAEFLDRQANGWVVP